MNFFEFHINDYEAACGHLSPLEDGIYMRLLRLYYKREQLLPLDVAQVCRLICARSDDERAATQQILEEFFTRTPEGWSNSRAESVIAAYHALEPAREAKRQNQQERQRRARERRAKLFEQLRERGVTPSYNAKTQELQAMLDELVTRDITVTDASRLRDDTATHYPLPTTHYPSINQSINQVPSARNEGAEIIGLQPLANGAFAMHQDWLPSTEFLSELPLALSTHKTAVELLAYLPEFVSYWLAQPNPRLCNQQGWENKYLKNVQFKLQRAQEQRERQLR